MNLRIMTLEQQVCSREHAEKLRDLGVKQDSLYFWRHGSIAGWYLSQARETLMEQAAAFTVAELGEMLPWEAQDEKFKKYSFWTAPVNEGNEWGVAYEGAHENLGGFVFVANTEADARAKMLIYLIENKLITV